jgi:hypothetical protein
LQNKEKNQKKKSGGIIVVFKNNLSKCLHFIKSDSEYVQWLEFTKCLNSDMLLGCVFIPPENSKYSSEEAFIEVEDELLFFSRDHKNIALAGDFNSRTSNVSDIVELDDNLFDMLDISNVTKANIRSTKMANNRHAYNRYVLQSYWTSYGLPLCYSQPTCEKTHTNQQSERLTKIRQSTGNI